MTIAEANEPLSNRLKIIIAQKGLKNLYVAESAGYTPQELSDMLNGRRLIKACDIPRIANGHKNLNVWKTNGWKRSGDRELKNADLWQEIDKQLSGHAVRFQTEF